jgi:ABC-type multidrug transport system fused ATPase/permease subunit
LLNKTINTTLRQERWQLLRALGRVGRPLLVSMLLLRLLASLVPAAIALAVAAIVHEIMASTELTDVWPPLAWLGLVFFIGRMVPEISGAWSYVAEQRIDGSQRAELTALASSSDTIDVLEQVETQRLIRQARADREFWTEQTPGQGALAQLDLIFSYLSIAASCVPLALFAWWLVPVVGIAAVLTRLEQRRQFLEHVKLEGDGIMDGLRSDYWKKLATEWTGGKEVRTFGLAGWAADKSRHYIVAKFAPTWDVAGRSIRAQWKIAALSGIPLVFAYAVVAEESARGLNSIALATAVFAASWSIMTTFGLVDIVLIEGAIPGVKALARLRMVLSSPPAATATDPVAAVRCAASPPLIRFEQVGFVYPGTDGRILESVDLEIRPGELLAIVGLNGAGKSTLIKLLTGLYVPSSGRITVDGVELGAIGAAAWRRQVCAVFQDFIRYNLTALDNVTMGRTMIAPQPEVARSAADDAGLSSVINDLPRGWSTPLSTARRGGVDLSGGQWQQVALTRAIYALRTGARLAIVDEPTAHMDVRTEAEVMNCLAKYHGEASVVLVSHRLATVRRADRIVLLEDGRITENGSHDELMAACGRYAEMFRIQAARLQRGYEDRLEDGELP